MEYIACMKPANMSRISHVELPQPNKMLVIESLDYNNPYDYKKMHRHDYFEIILIKEGTGDQLIDFSPYAMNQGDIFLIYPGQVHLMNRNTTSGLLIQFRKDIFQYIHPIKHFHLYSTPQITLDQALFLHLFDITERMHCLLKTDNELSSIAIHKAYSYLQIILIYVIESKSATLTNDKEKYIVEEYLSLVTTHIRTKRKVSEYSELLNCASDKLNEHCKRSIGKTALELIHQELLLEIRRLLLLGEMSLKEMAYYLNFDSQANFSAFIKNKTGLTPTDLQKTVLEIYN